MRYQPNDSSFHHSSGINIVQDNIYKKQIVEGQPTFSVEIVGYNRKSLFVGPTLLLPIIPSILFPRKCFLVFGLGPNGYWDDFSFGINIRSEANNIVMLKDENIQLLLNDSLILQPTSITTFKDFTMGKNDSALNINFNYSYPKRIKRLQLICKNKWLKKVFDPIIFYRKRKIYYMPIFEFN